MKKILEALKKMLADAKAAGKEVAETDLAAVLKLTPEDVSEFLTTDEGKKFLQPMLDTYHTKGLESWKTNNLAKLQAEAVETEIKKRFPAETPAEKEVRELRKRVEESEAKATRTELKNKAISVMTVKGLPIDLADHFLGSDEAATLANLATFEAVYNGHVTKIVEERMANGGRAPHSTANDSKTRLQELQGKLANDKALKLEERIAIRNEITALEKPAS